MQADLAALVGSRICHDLISPIGAISNGVELLALTDGGTGAEMALIKQSVESAAARIKFFRIAYGAATDMQTVGQAECKAILGAISAGGRITYDWQITDDQPRRRVRCIFLAIQTLETALPLGGKIGIRQNGDSTSLVASGRRIAFDPDLWSGLSNPEGDLSHSAAQVQFALLAILLKEGGLTAQIAHLDDRLSVQF